MDISIAFPTSGALLSCFRGMRGSSHKSSTQPEADLCLDGRRAKFLMGFSACCSPGSWYWPVRGGLLTVNLPFVFAAPDSTISKGHVWFGQREIHNSAVAGRRHFAALAAAQWDPLGISGHRDFPWDEWHASWWKWDIEGAHLMSVRGGKQFCTRTFFLPEMDKTTCNVQWWQQDYLNTQQPGGTFCFL